MAGFSLPLNGTEAREACGDLGHLVELLSPRNVGRLPTFSQALRAEVPAGARAVNVVCLRANDERWLIAVGPRGGWRKVWNFGTGR